MTASVRPYEAHLWHAPSARTRPEPLSDWWLWVTPPAGVLIGVLIHLFGPGAAVFLVGFLVAALADRTLLARIANRTDRP